MLRIRNYLKIVPKRHCNIPLLHRTITSHDIRQQFLDYFMKSNDHTFIRSSPVVPFCDPSLAFVNAGMNQFKNVFLGKRSAPCRRAVNSQKCVRVGGKHNDLSIVGTDGYHHTFFEMLGNWSFGDYFKKEACELAWNLLKGPYQIDISRLYVTYFGGDEGLQIPPDYECRDIWRSLGVADDRILPFGIQENFWVMGSTGPCGPSTEIHIDHIPNSRPAIRASRVNAGFSDLTELWNVVFIEYNLNVDGSVTSLPMKHIDTGMGMERLVAVLQGKSSNYETDLFRPIIDRIQKVTNAPQYVDCYDLHDPNYEINNAYRTLADHTRMITACLADEMIPEQNQKLRRVLRKSLSISSKTFGSSNLLHEIVPVVIEILGDTYPEMQRTASHIHQIISHENDVLENLKQNNSSKIMKILNDNPRLDVNDLLEYSGFVQALEKVRSQHHNENTISGDLMYYLYDTYGLNVEIMEKIAQNEGLKLDRNGFAEQVARKRNQTLQDYNQRPLKIDLSKSEPTDSDWKYVYEFNKTNNQFVVPKLSATIIAIEDRENGMFDLILDKTNFYYESGGQAHDVGQIIHKNGLFNVERVSCINDIVIHSGKFIDGRFELNDLVELVVDATQRTGNTRNHTATHLLHASVKSVTKSVTYQKSSRVLPSGLKIDLGILGYKQDISSIDEIEKLVRSIIQSSTPITTTMTDSHGLYNSEGVTLVPGEVYPDSKIRILTINNKDHNFTSKEPCCGTHASNTSELEDFCITNVKASGRRSFIFSGITGPKATQAHVNGKEIMNELIQMESVFDKEINQIDNFNSKIQQFRETLSQNNDFELPHIVRTKCLDIVDSIRKRIKDKSMESLKDFIDIEMKNVLQNSPKESHPFIVHFLTCGTLMETVPLEKATRFFTDRPIIVLSLTNGVIRARCCVPSNFVTEKFSAYLWLTTVADVFETQIRPPQRGQNKDVSHIKPKKISSVIFDERLESAMQQAADFARNNM